MSTKNICFQQEIEIRKIYFGLKKVFSGTMVLTLKYSLSGIISIIVQTG